MVSVPSSPVILKGSFKVLGKIVPIMSAVVSGPSVVTFPLLLVPVELDLIEVVWGQNIQDKL